MASRRRDSYFDDAAKEVFAAGRRTSRVYNNLDIVWTHPSGASIYVGNINAAQTRSILDSHNVTHVVNCQDVKSRNFFEKDPKMSYFRFPVSYWWRAPGMDTDEGVLAFFAPLFGWITAALEKGCNVMVHCLAGAHRAGTTGPVCIPWVLLSVVTDFGHAFILTGSRA